MPNNVMFVTSYTFILYTIGNFYILRHIGYHRKKNSKMMCGLIYAENRKIRKAVKIDLHKVLKNKKYYSKGHLRTRLKGLIDIIRNHFSLCIRTHIVLICINLNSSATKF